MLHSFFITTAHDDNVSAPVESQNAILQSGCVDVCVGLCVVEVCTEEPGAWRPRLDEDQRYINSN